MRLSNYEEFLPFQRVHAISRKINAKDEDNPEPYGSSKPGIRK